MNKPTVLITGANGFLGSELVNHFTNKGWMVLALVRNANRSQDQGGIKYVEYDLTKPFDAKIFQGADYLVHAAYIKQDRKNPNAINLNVMGAKNLLAASRKYGLKKNVFISSMSAHDGAISAYGRQKLSIEKLFNTSKDISLRPGLIIGNGGIVKSMTSFMRSKHMVPLIGGGKQPLQIIGVHDVAAAVEQALTRNLYGVLTIATINVYTYKEFYKTLGKHINTRILFIPIPFSILLLGVRLVSYLHLPLSINEDNLLGLKKLRSVDTRQDLEKLGIKLDTLKMALGKKS